MLWGLTMTLEATERTQYKQFSYQSSEIFSKMESASLSKFHLSHKKRKGVMEEEVPGNHTELVSRTL